MLLQQTFSSVACAKQLCMVPEDTQCTALGMLYPQYNALCAGLQHLKISQIPSGRSGLDHEGSRKRLHGTVPEVPRLGQCRHAAEGVLDRPAGGCAPCCSNVDLVGVGQEEAGSESSAGCQISDNLGSRLFLLDTRCEGQSLLDIGTCTGRSFLRQGARSGKRLGRRFLSFYNAYAQAGQSLSYQLTSIL